MSASEVYQQSFVGTILSFPVKIIKFLFTVVKHLLLLPFYAVKYLFIGLQKIFLLLTPEFYGENVTMSLKGSFFTFLTLFILVSVALFAALTPFYLVGLVGSFAVLKNFDLIQALLVMGKAIGGTESVFIALSLGGFVLSFVLTVLSITIYTPIQWLGEWAGFLTDMRGKVFTLFGITPIVFGISYLLVTGKIPI